MSKKNLPNIPIYIGDWERDCNVLSLESEAAWMRIVFKLWTKGKQNSIKIPTKSLQNLWRCSEATMRRILDDLIFNEICEVEDLTDAIVFTCRRFVRENRISEIRSVSGSSRKPKSKQTLNKKKTKGQQNPDNEIEIESKSKINYDFTEIVDFVKSKDLDFKVDFTKLKLKIDSWECNNWRDGNGKKIKNLKSKVLNQLPYMKLKKEGLDFGSIDID